MGSSIGKWEEATEEHQEKMTTTNEFSNLIASPENNNTNLDILKVKLEGAKFSSEKAPMGMMLKQFSLALEAVAYRSKTGHEGKYKESDKDWMNFKRVPNALEEYANATARHLAEIGEDEDFIGHAAATAWNALARLQLILENK